jgi:hypothetical protein
MATPWTLEQELCSLTGTSAVGEALARLGIVGEATPEPRLEEVQGWMRSGGETYIYRFRVITVDGVHELLLKAIVAFSLTCSLSEIGNEWVRRRRLLEQAGIRPPALYHAGRALLLEKYVPEKLSTFLNSGPAEARLLSDQVIRYAAVLEKHGFRPLSPFHSLRTDGANVFAVDFGQDLGPPGLASKPGRRLLREAINWLRSAGKQSIDERHAAALYTLYTEDKDEGIRWS